MKDLFDEIDEERKELPKLKKISKEVQKKRDYNFYQQLAVCLFIFLFVVGVILGNLFPACSEASSMFNTCTRTEYNLSLTLLFWLASFVFCSLIYGLGEVISLLNKIASNINK
ncbi:MAG TPA: hypothetical protein IAB45_00460 [Candidatus Onthousia faecavium]|nr:hypothetical protein [Candidatus Onthousia faecavium]